jgi:hypothetical protein
MPSITLPTECPEDKCLSLITDLDEAAEKARDAEAVMEYTFQQWMEHQGVAIDACAAVGESWTPLEVALRLEACRDALEEANDRKEEHEEAMEAYGNALVEEATARDELNDCLHVCEAEEMQIIEED